MKPNKTSNTAKMSRRAWNEDLECARVSAMQQMLIPNTPRAVCEYLNLNWWAALKLWDTGNLSFDPEGTPHLNESQEAELRFVGALVARGCDPAMLRQLLQNLKKPHSYNDDLLYYDWASGSWRLLPDADPESVFSTWIEKLKESEDRDTLLDLASTIEQALDEIGPPEGTDSELGDEAQRTGDSSLFDPPPADPNCSHPGSV